MENDAQQKITEPVTSERSQAVQTVTPSRQNPKHRGRFQNARPDRKKGPRAERARSEFDQKILAIRRVTRVASGGRRFSFSVALVLGNRKDSVGVGTGKASDTSLAIDKAAKNARKHLLRLSLTKTASIPYEVGTKYASARVFLMPAHGRGIIAGSALRDVLELSGARDISGKIFSGSKNKLNIARATVKALSEFAAPKDTAAGARKQENPETVAEQVPVGANR